jgi:small subunit ribosomal protein S8
MVRDPLSDLVAQIKNGYLAGLTFVTMPISNLRLAVAKVLSEAGFVGRVEVADNQLKIELKYQSKKAAITEIVRVSKPGSRVYCSYKDLQHVLGGLGMQVISTPQGVMSDKKARKAKVGGEVICKVW